MKPFSLRVGLRYTRAKRRNHFISFISFVSIIGILLGVMVLITVLSVMNGFDKEMHERIFGVSPHITVYGMQGNLDNWQLAEKKLLSQPEVKFATPFIEGQGLLTHQAVSHFSLINGIDPKAEDKATEFEQKMQTGSLYDLVPGQYNIILGKKIAEYLGVLVGDKVTMVLPEASMTVAGVLPRTKRFTVSGIFEIGYDFDSSLVLINIKDAQKVFKMKNSVSGLNLRIDNMYAAPRIGQKIANHFFDEFIVTDWTIRNGNFFKAIKLEKTLMFVLLIMIVLVATFNILATLIMIVTEKRADIAILRTMGASPGSILRIFIIQGTVIGVVGTFLGIVLGLLLATNITEIMHAVEQYFHIQLMSADVYYISYLPSDVRISDIVTVGLLSLLMSFTFTLYPAWRASRTQPVEVLRYE